VLATITKISKSSSFSQEKKLHLSIMDANDGKILKVKEQGSPIIFFNYDHPLLMTNKTKY
jgi:hypothetical protein